MFSRFFRQHLAAAKAESLVGRTIASLGYGRARADVPQDPHLPSRSEAGTGVCKDGRAFMARPRKLEPEPAPEPEPEPERKIAVYRSLSLAAHVRDWKDIDKKTDCNRHLPRTSFRNEPRTGRYTRMTTAF